MKKIFLFLFIAVFALCSCSDDDSHKYDNCLNNIYGVYEVAGVLDNSNINKSEPFVLYANSTDYNDIWWCGENKYTNDVGEFYAGKLRYQICKSELNNNYLTLYVYHPEDNLGYIYKFSFNIEPSHNGYVLTCVDSEPTKYLRINRNDKIRISYLGFHIEEWAPKLFNYNSTTNTFYIPNGTYVQVNSTPKEHSSVIINGNHIKYEYFNYGEYWEEEYYYVLSNNEIIIFKNGKEINRTSWSVDGNLLTLGEIMYLKQ